MNPWLGKVNKTKYSDAYKTTNGTLLLLTKLLEIGSILRELPPYYRKQGIHKLTIFAKKQGRYNIAIKKADITLFDIVQTLITTTGKNLMSALQGL